jgi:Putative transposase
LLSPLKLIGRIAALVPPPRTHRYRYYGVLAANAPLRAVVTAMAQARPAKGGVGQADSGASEGTPGRGLSGNAPDGGGSVAAPIPPIQIVQAPAAEPPRRFPAHYLWAVLIARIYEVFPLVCPRCGGSMRILAFVTEGVQIRRILEHIGVDIQAPRIAPARGPRLWEDCDAKG